MYNSDTTDHQLMSEIVQGRLSALDCLVGRYQQKVFSFAYRVLGDWHSAEDVAQETFVRLYNAAPEYKADAKLVTFIYTIALNLCRDIQRKSSRGIQSELPVEVLGNYEKPETALIRNENAKAVAKAVAALPERQKTALLLHRFDGLSHAEVANIMNISVSAAESLLVRAYTALRQSLAKIQDF